MTEKKFYEEAQIEVIEFECKDILTTSSPQDLAELIPDQTGKGGSTWGFRQNIN